MFAAIKQFWLYMTIMTPARRAKGEIAELERDLYEARKNRCTARQNLQAKELRIEQLCEQIAELKRDYPQDDAKKKEVRFMHGGTKPEDEPTRIIERMMRTEKGRTPSSMLNLWEGRRES